MYVLHALTEKRLHLSPQFRDSRKLERTGGMSRPVVLFCTKTGDNSYNME